MATRLRSVFENVAGCVDMKCPVSLPFFVVALVLINNVWVGNALCFFSENSCNKLSFDGKR